MILGDSIEVIGKTAFAECSSIDSVRLPESIKVIRADAFNGCTNLSELFIGANIDTIEGGAFEKTEIKRLIIADSDVELKYPQTGWYSNPFNTKYLEYIYYGRQLSDTTIFKVKSSSKLKTLEFGPAVTLIPESFAEWCDSLRTIKFGGNEKHIGKSAFYSCKSLEEVVLPNSVTLLDKNSFNSCTALKRLVLSDSLKKIDDGAFWGCAAIDGELVIPASIDTIVSGAFGGTYGRTIAVKRLIFEDSERPLVHYINGFGNTFATPELRYLYYGRPLTDTTEFRVKGCKHLDTLTFGPSVTIIPKEFALSCDSLKKINFSEKETYIGESAFSGCNSLEEVVVPNSVTLLDKNSFNSCGALKRLVLSDSLKKIDNGAFWGCAAIDGELVIPASVDSIGEGAFGGTYGRKVAVTSLVFEDGESPIAVKSNSFGFSQLESLYDGRRFDGDFNVRGVDSLKSLSFGAGIDSIPNSFATGCPNIKSVTSNAIVPPVLGEYFVDEKVYKTAELTVPDTAVAAYKEARLWKEFYKINGEDVSVPLVGADMPVVYAVGNTIVIPSAKAGDKIMVCDFSGVVLYFGNDNMISINGKGVYIVVVNGVGQKVMVK